MRSWNQPSSLDAQVRIHKCATDLGVWSRDGRKQFRSQLANCRGRIKALKHLRDEASIGQVKEARQELNDLQAKQEDYWKQRAKQHWLASGDVNSRFFHQSASTRKRINEFSQ